MIHVQIASQLTAHGVSGVRWVLLEPSDGLQANEPAPALALSAGHAADAADDAVAAGESTAPALRLGALKLVVVSLGLGAALWTAHVQVGPPGAPPQAPQPARAPALPSGAATAAPTAPQGATGATDTGPANDTSKPTAPTNPTPAARPAATQPADVADPTAPAAPATPAAPAAPTNPPAAMPRLTAAL